VRLRTSSNSTLVTRVPLGSRNAWSWGSCLAVVAVVASAALAQPQVTPARAQEDTPPVVHAAAPPAVETAAAPTPTPTLTLATRERNRLLSITAPSNGNVEVVYVRAGDHVEAGQALLTFSDHQAASNVARLRLDIASARARAGALEGSLRTLDAAIAAALLPPGPPYGNGTGHPWQVSGYQFDMDSANQYTGQLYEGQGRNIITAPGTIGMLLPGNCKILLGKLPGDAKAAIKAHQGLAGEWQQIEIIVRGNTMIHMINGQVMSVTVDDDPVARAPQGILSLQLEGSGQIWYRNVYVKPLR